MLTSLYVISLILRRFNKIVASILSAVVIGINIYFVMSFVETSLPESPLVYFGLSIFGVCYLAFCLYLTLHVMVSMGVTWFESNRVSPVRNAVGVSRCD